MENEVVTGTAVGAGVMMLYIALILISVIGMWKLFTKAGKPGWACIIPIYNMIVLLEIAGKPIWWIILFFIPIVNVVISILMYVGIAERFGRGVGTALGLIFFPIIFMMILGFGSAEYQALDEA